MLRHELNHIIVNKIIFLSSFFVLISVSVACTKDEAPGVMPNDSFGMNADQVELYASIFAPFLSDVENGENEATKAVSGQEKILEDIDYFIEDGDTLMYAFNYQNDGGYLLIGSDNSSFPILAHSKIGNIHFDDIDRSGAFYYYLSKIKERIKYNLSHASSTDSEYYENWKDLGKDGYEYEITAVNSAPGPDTKARRDYSSGRAMVYPYTGYDLDLWCQTAGYNYYAPRKAKIGCPALAIGMLIYDTEQRLSGNHTPTMPYFDYKDKEAIPDTTKSSHVAQVLKQIADYIPNYSWGWANGIPSGARASDVLAGLKNLGYIKATMEPYDLDMLYKANVEPYVGQSTIRMSIIDCENDEVDHMTMSFEDFASDDYIHIARKIRNEDKAKRKNAEQEAKKQKELEEKETRRQMYEQLKEEFEND